MKRGISLQPEDLISVARLLVLSRSGRPAQASLRRAMSTAYYALFHLAARNCADMLIGASKAGRSRHAWVEVYRSLAHGAAKAACEDKTTIARFPKPIGNFANVFSELQAARHRADYDPNATFEKSYVRFQIDVAELTISDFASAPTKDRRAFASWLLFRNIARR